MPHLWTGNFSIKEMRDGVPRYVEFSTDYDTEEAGIHKAQRSLRLASSGLALFGVAILYGLFVCKPTPIWGRIGNLLTCLLVLLPGAIVAFVGFGFDVSDLSDVNYCPRGGLASINTARNGSPLNLANQNFRPTPDEAVTQPCEEKQSIIVAATVFNFLLGLFILILIAAVLYYTWTGDWIRKRNPRNWRQREADVERDRGWFKQKTVAAKDGWVNFDKVAKTNKILVALILTAVFVLAVLVLAFSIVLHEYRGQIVTEAQSLGKEPLSEPEAGWSVRNIRLRLAVTSATLLVILISFIPWRSRIIAQLFGLTYFALSVLAFAALGYDLRELLDVGDRVCPQPFECKSAMFGGITGLDFLLALWLLGYVLWEFVSRWFVVCPYTGRGHTWAEIGAVLRTCGKRPVVCEITGMEVTADEYVYKHRMVVGQGHTRCDRCGMFVPEWGIKEHEAECPKWPVKCTMCNQTFYRCDMPRHVLHCPYRPVTCEFCGETFKKQDMDGHLGVCPEMLIDCPLSGPRFKVKRRNLDFWLREECPNRLVYSEQLGRSVPAYKLEELLWKHNQGFDAVDHLQGTVEATSAPTWQ